MASPSRPFLIDALRGADAAWEATPNRDELNAWAESYNADPEGKNAYVAPDSILNMARPVQWPYYAATMAANLPYLARDTADAWARIAPTMPGGELSGLAEPSDDDVGTVMLSLPVFGGATSFAGKAAGAATKAMSKADNKPLAGVVLSDDARTYGLEKRGEPRRVPTYKDAVSDAIEGDFGGAYEAFMNAGKEPFDYNITYKDATLPDHVASGYIDGDTARFDWLGDTGYDVETGANRQRSGMGIKGLKELREAFREKHPEVKNFEGVRVSGARGEAGKQGEPGSLQRLKILSDTDNKPLAGVVLSDGEFQPMPEALAEHVAPRHEKQLRTAAKRKASVDEDDALGVVHNLTQDNLAYTDDRYGGHLPVPSLAATKPTTGIGGFGEISLIGHPGFVSPSAKNPAFRADAYSPRFPSVETQISTKDIIKLQEDAAKKVGPEGAKMLDELDVDFAERIASSGFDPSDTSTLMASYLSDVGKLPNPSDYVGNRWQWRNAMRDEIASDPAAARQWIKEYLPGLGIDAKERIFQGFTHAGNRRYKPHTLENVVRAMKGGPDAEGFNYGLGSTRAAITRPFSSIKEMQAERGRVQPRAALDEAKEVMQGERLNDIASMLGSWDKYPASSYGFGHLDTTLARIAEAYEGGTFRPRVLEEYYPGITSDEFAMRELHDFISDTRSMPTEYFEIKPQRAVGLDEFSGAIVPDTAGKATTDILQKYGIKDIATYKRGQDDARSDAMRQFGGLLFSQNDNKALAAALLADREIDAAGFYSPSLEAAKQLKQEKGTVEQMRKQLLKSGGKEKELAATGFDKHFPDPNAKVTRDAMIEYLRENRIAPYRTKAGSDDINYELLEEAEQQHRDHLWDEGDLKEYIDEETGETVMEAFGDEVYRGPEDTPAHEAARERMWEIETNAFNEASNYGQRIPGVTVDFAPTYQNYFPKFGDSYAEMLMALPSREGVPDFTGSHWSTPNVLAHNRYGDFTDQVPLSPEQLAERSAKEARLNELWPVKEKYNQLWKDLLDDPVAKEALANKPFYEGAEPSFGNYDAQQFARMPFEDQLNEIGRLEREASQMGKIDARYAGEFQSDWAQKGRKAGFRAATDEEVAQAEAARRSAHQALLEHREKGLDTTDFYIFEIGGVLDMSNVPRERGKKIAAQLRDIVKTDSLLERAKRHLSSSEEKLSNAPSGSAVAEYLKEDVKLQREIWRANEAEREREIEAYKKEVEGIPILSFAKTQEYRNTLKELQLRNEEAIAAAQAAQSGIPSAPFVTNTSDWVDFALKNSLIDAAEDGIDRLYTPTGDAVRSYTYGSESGQGGFYGGPGERGIVPTRLQKVLKTIDKDARVQLSDETDFGGIMGSPDRFPYVDLTPEMRERIRKEGLPLFARAGDPTTAAIIDILRNQPYVNDTDEDGG